MRAEPADDPGMEFAWFDQALKQIYSDLERSASCLLYRHPEQHTRETGDLVHAVYAKLRCGDPSRFESPLHLLNVASIEMEQVLIDWTRRRVAKKRGGPGRVGAGVGALAAETTGYERVTLTESSSSFEVDHDGLIDIRTALDGMQADCPLAVQILRMAFYLNLGREEIARRLSVSLKDVSEQLGLAQHQLRRRLGSAYRW